MDMVVGHFDGNGIVGLELGEEHGQQHIVQVLNTAQMHVWYADSGTGPADNPVPSDHSVLAAPAFSLSIHLHDSGRAAVHRRLP